MNRFFVSFIISINSGIGFALLTSVFTMYLKDNEIDIVTIGLLSLRMTPYSFKYFWSPFVENVKISFFPKGFGQRKSWLLITQFLLVISIISMMFIDVKQNLNLFCIMAFFISFISATYDIAMEAFRIELFNKYEINKGTLFNVLGFRVGRVITAAGGLYLSYILNWNYVFLIIASLILPCMVIIFNSKDNKEVENNHLISTNFVAWFKKNFLLPFIFLYRKKHFTLTLITIAFYKLSDGYVDTMLIPFLRDVGHTKAEIASVAKVMGTFSTILGTFIGTYLIGKFKIIHNLLAAEIFASISNLLFITLINSPTSIVLLSFTMSIENFFSGICNIMLIQYMSSLCSKRFTATHYAILISISSIAKNFLSSLSGFVALSYGWTNFFLISSLLSVPSIICIYFLNKYKTIE